MKTLLKTIQLSLHCFAILWLGGFPMLSFGAEIDPLFVDNEIINITISGPFTTIDNERDKEKEYEGGKVTYLDNGQEVSLDVKFEVRGNFRLREDICNYAQLWLDFDKDEVEGTLFENQNKLKLVVQCKQGDRYERYIVKEQQSYQIFNTLTDLSFRSRLLNVTYVDTDRGREKTTLGILIEHKDRVANRNELTNVDLNKIGIDQLAQQQANLVDMYMFMIANTDYSIISAPEGECCHNAKLFQPVGEDLYFPAPYDFDSSGYVDAGYALPNPALRLRNIRQRLYRGFCFPENVLNTTLQNFRDKQEQILAITGDSTFVNERTARRSTEYLQKFYDIINDPEALEKEILDDCRG